MYGFRHTRSITHVEQFSYYCRIVFYGHVQIGTISKQLEHTNLSTAGVSLSKFRIIK